MEGLIRWWVRNPVAANLLMFIIVTLSANLLKGTCPAVSLTR